MKSKTLCTATVFVALLALVGCEARKHSYRACAETTKGTVCYDWTDRKDVIERSLSEGRRLYPNVRQWMETK